MRFCADRRLLVAIGGRCTVATLTSTGSWLLACFVAMRGSSAGRARCRSAERASGRWLKPRRLARHRRAPRALGRVRLDARRMRSRRRSFVDRYPPGRQQSAIIPLLDLAQRQIGAETETQGWLPIPVIEFVARRARHALYPRLRGRDLLHDVQPRARSAATTSRSAAPRPACCAARTTCSPPATRKGMKKGAHDRRRPVHPDRGRVPRRLRQRADGPDQRRQLRGPDLREHDRDPRRARQGRDAEGRARRSSARPAAPRAARPRSRRWSARITIIGDDGERAISPSSPRSWSSGADRGREDRRQAARRSALRSRSR